MTSSELHEYMLSLPGAVEDRPFGPDVPVYKVMGKMFAYVAPRRPHSWLTLKLDPLTVLDQLSLLGGARTRMTSRTGHAIEVQRRKALVQWFGCAQSSSRNVHRLLLLAHMTTATRECRDTVTSRMFFALKAPHGVMSNSVAVAVAARHAGP